MKCTLHPDVRTRMVQLYIGSILLSLLHAVLPNHWLPLLAIGRTEKWSTREVTWIAFLCGSAHAISTIVIGFILGFLGYKISANISSFTKIIAPAILLVMGLYFIYQHHRHHHFHMHQQPDPAAPKIKIIAVLTAAMFLSPCLEIEGYFLVAGTKGLSAILTIGMIYILLSIGGMVLWIRWAFQKSRTFNWHALEHNAGIITGGTLMVTGIITFFVS
jgi:nickel/cobalt transporter (NicO) family protein